MYWGSSSSGFSGVAGTLGFDDFFCDDIGLLSGGGGRLASKLNPVGEGMVFHGSP